jgi:5-methyltetrahydropteroyltriglutamate--homocysteine methyltransferase
MQRSTDRILTTHTGSLPRPPELIPLLFAHEEGSSDQAALDRATAEAVQLAVGQQAQAGVDVLNDGEMGKMVYATYVKDRLSGFGGEGRMVGMGDLIDYPEYGERMFREMGAEETMKHMALPSCNGPVSPKPERRRLVERDIRNLQEAARGVSYRELFMTSASPGVIALFLDNRYYQSRETYLQAIADAMQPEYEAIAQAGIVLQLDCPDLAMGRHIQFNDLDLEDFRRQARMAVEALNHATRNIDPDQMRLHLCWGNYEGPHHRDVALRDIIDIVFEARPNGISLEACNPRHAHEWEVFEELKLPPGKVLIPGVIDSTNNYIEHPDLIAQRLRNYVKLLGQENVMASSDCGFGTAAGASVVDPKISWAKFQAMAEGARLASRSPASAAR